MKKEKFVIICLSISTIIFIISIFLLLFSSKTMDDSCTKLDCHIVITNGTNNPNNACIIYYQNASCPCEDFLPIVYSANITKTCYWKDSFTCPKFDRHACDNLELDSLAIFATILMAISAGLIVILVPAGIWFGCQRMKNYIPAYNPDPENEGSYGIL